MCYPELHPKALQLIPQGWKDSWGLQAPTLLELRVCQTLQQSTLEPSDPHPRGLPP